MNWELKKQIVERFGAQWKFAHAIGEQEARVSLVVREKLRLKSEKKNQWALALGVERSAIFEDEKNANQS